MLFRSWAEVMAGPDGGTLFLLALLREHHPTLTAADARRVAAAEPERVGAALERVTPSFLAAVAREAGATADQTAALLARLKPSGPTSPSAG